MCGFIGLIGPDHAAGPLAEGLLVLQHRGQDAAGITTFDGDQFHTHRGAGMVREIFRPEGLAQRILGFGDVVGLMQDFEKHVDKDCVRRLAAMIESTFERLDYGEAIKQLEGAKKKFEFGVKWGMDLQSEHERWLTEELVGRPVAVLDYPKDIKAFYMRLNDDGRTVAAMDVLAPGIGEIIGGSQREERLDVLDARIAELGLDVADYGWYRDLRRYGTVPHAGFGLGFERLVMYVTGMENIRDVTPFPRTPRNCEF